jgi:hypothetical protein
MTPIEAQPATVDPEDRIFPTEALPDPLRPFVEECARSLPVPVELVAVPSLVVAGAAIGNARRIRLKEDWTESAALYAAIVSASGTMKSPALEAVADPIRQKQTKGGRTWTADTTVERMAGLLNENPRGLLLIRDELSAWVKSMNQYRSGKGADKQFYLSAWGGSPIAVDRKGSFGASSVLVDRPFLSVVGCLPPDVLPDLDDAEGREDGFLPRILFSWPDRMKVRWVLEAVSAEARAGYNRRIEELFAIPWEESRVYLDLTPDARSLFVKWHDAHCAEAESPSLSPFLQGGYAKLKGYGARLALIHAVTTDPTATAVGAESVAAAADLIDYFKAQAAKVAPLLSHSKWNPIERCRQEIRR